MIRYAIKYVYPGGHALANATVNTIPEEAPFIARSQEIVYSDRHIRTGSYYYYYYENLN
jgi:hypothetical protein